MTNNIAAEQRQSTASSAVREAIEHAAVLWHAEHPDDPRGMDYTTSGNVFLQVAEHIYCMTQPERHDGPVLYPPKRPNDAAVYIAYGDQDEIIYIGVTSNFNRRMYAHRKKSGWWPYAVSVVATSYPSRFSANTAEILAIQRYKPAWNQMWAR